MAVKRKKAGHRRWAAGGQKVAGTHRGDIMSAEKRSALMSRIKGKGTKPEQLMVAALRAEGFEFEQHVRDLPGTPDIVFRDARVVVFVDGDFWHGWRFPLWEHKLSIKWREKIAATRRRDQRNFRTLRREGWVVLRIWEHQVENNIDRVVARVIRLLCSRACRQC